MKKDGIFSQKHWGDQVNRELLKDLLASSTLRDKVRLTSTSQQHAGDWLRVAPNPNLGSHIENTDFLLLSSFHLGVPILPAAAAGAPCLKCGQPLDRFGDHLVSCPQAGAWKRHNGGLCSPLNSIATAAGFDVDLEQSVQGRRRPADLLIHKWRNGRDAAVDPTVIRSLNPSHKWDPSNPAVDKAEAEKHKESDAICEAAGVDFIPVGADTFGALGKDAQDFMCHLFKRYARRTTHDEEVSFPGQLQRECWQRLSVALQKAVATQLCQIFIQMGGDWASPFHRS